MTPEQHRILREFIITRNHATNRISKEEFLGFFPSTAERAEIVSELIEEARKKRNAGDLRSALAIGFIFGLSATYNHALCELIQADWHHSHEDIVWALQGIALRDQETIDTLYEATQTVPAYLEYHEARALAVKAIWALGKIERPEAEEKLEQLAKEDDPTLSENARKQLERQRRQGR